MRILNPALLTVAALLFTACDGGAGKASADKKADAPKAEAAAPALDIGETLADVGGVPVGSKEFQEAAARKKPAEGNSLSVAEKREVLDRLVDEKLLYKAALSKGLDKDPKVQKVMVNTLLRQEVYANVRNSDFTDEELQAYYESHKDDFVVPEKVQIKRILVKVGKERSEAEAQEIAKNAYKQLKKNPESFKDVAAKVSEDPYRRRGGDVGFVPRTGKPGLATAVVEKAFEMKVDQLSEPFVTDEGVNIVYVANKRERVERTFQQMKGSVLRKVKNEKLKEMYESYVANLRTGAKITVDDAKLAAVEVKASARPMTKGAELSAGGVDEDPMVGMGGGGEE
jgi:parvulin-like peptidyl-prolyl isomerase